jgi:uncharacterized protein (DUF1800 family)
MPVLPRLSFALLLALAACSVPAARTSSNGGQLSPLIVVEPTEPREQTADEQVQQVLNRLAFGPRPGDVAAVRAMGVDRWIALQLAPDRIRDDSADAVVASYEMLGRPTSELVSMYQEGQLAVQKLQRQQAQSGDTNSKRDLRAEVLRNDPQLREKLRQNQRILQDVQSAKLARAVSSDRQLEEVMTDFWENHFTVYAGKGLTRIYIPSFDRDVIRPRALGKFRDLLGAVAKSPAMLFFLDQWQSSADSLHPTLASTQTPRAGLRVRPGVFAARAARPAPPRRRGGLNENYARELMELHTLGVDGGYTQADVIEVARALTGWTMNPRQGAEFVFRPAIHDAGEKVVLGHRLPAGRGIEDGEEVLDIIARDPHTAQFIARKLAVRFVSDSPPQALVDRAAKTFLATDGDIREVVRTIVTSPEFFSRAAYRSKVKTPFELVASALRAIGAAPDTSIRSAQVVAFLGQPIFGHQAPNGWPETGEEWMNSGAILNRINFGLALAGGRLPNASVARWSEGQRLLGESRDQQVDAVVNAFLGGHVSPDTREVLLNGENPLVAKLGASAGDSSRTVGEAPTMQGAAASPVAAGRRGGGGAGGLGRPVQLSGLAQVVGLAIGAPEFQRR